MPGEQPTPRQRRVALATLAAALLAGAAFFAIYRPVPPPAPVAAVSSPAVTLDPTATPRDTSSVEPTSTPTTLDAPNPSATSPGPPSTTSSADTHPPTSTAPKPPPAPAPAAQPPGAPCRPNALIIPDLGVNASVVTIGLDASGNLGAPTDADKRKIGWFPSVQAGAPRGSVIFSGHTYHDESAIFKTTFNTTAHVGMTVQIACPAGGSFTYRVTQAKLNLSVQDYAGYIDQNNLYAKDGPARVIIVTCTDWNPLRRDYDQRGILVATPA